MRAVSEDRDTGACYRGPFCRRSRDRVRHVHLARFSDAFIGGPVAHRTISVAIATTKVPMLLDKGFWAAAREGHAPTSSRSLDSYSY